MEATTSQTDEEEQAVNNASSSSSSQEDQGATAQESTREQHGDQEDTPSSRRRPHRVHVDQESMRTSGAEAYQSMLTSSGVAASSEDTGEQPQVPYESPSSHQETTTTTEDEDTEQGGGERRGHDSSSSYRDTSDTRNSGNETRYSSTGTSNGEGTKAQETSDVTQETETSGSEPRYQRDEQSHNTLQQRVHYTDTSNNSSSDFTGTERTDHSDMGRHIRQTNVQQTERTRPGTGQVLPESQRRVFAVSKAGSTLPAQRYVDPSSTSSTEQSGFNLSYDEYQRFQERLSDHIARLQDDLASTMNVCRELRKENDELSTQYESLQNDHSELTEKFNSIKEQCMQEVESRISTERKYEELCDQWRDQLRQKEEEFAKLKEQFQPPPDLDELKIQVREEIEGPYEEKQSELQKNIEEYRHLYYSTRKELESYKQHLAEHQQSREKEYNSIQASYENEVNELRESWRQAQEQIDKLRYEFDTKTRKMRETANYSSGAAQVAEKEAQELRQERDHLKSQVNDLQLQMDRISAKNDKERTERSQQLDSALEEVEYLRSKCSSQESTINELQSKLNSARGDNKSLHLDISSLKDEMVKTKQDSQCQVEQYRSRSQQQEVEMKKQIEDEKSRADIAEKKVFDLEEQLKSLETTNQRTVQSLKSNYEKQLSHLQTSGNDKADEINRQMIEDMDIFGATKLRKQVQEAQNSMHKLNSELSSARGEASRYKHLYEESRAEVDQLNRKIKELRDSLEDASKHESKVTKYSSELHRIKEEKRQLEDAVDRLRDELQKVEDDNKRLQSQSQSIEERIQQRDDEWKSHLSHVRKELKKEKAQEVKEIRTKAEEYKRKLLDVFKKFQELKAVCNALKTERDIRSQHEQSSLDQAHKQIRQLERERELYLHGSRPVNDENVSDAQESVASNDFSEASYSDI